MKQFYIFLGLFMISTSAKLQTWNWAHSLDPQSGSVTDIYSKGDNSWITGGHSTAFTCDGNSIPEPGGGIFLTKINASGNCDWKRTINGVFSGTHVFVDEMENVFLTGGFAESIQVDGFTLHSPNNFSTDIFVLKFDKHGAVVWARSFGSPNDWNILGSTDLGQAITGDSQGALYIGGEFQGKVTFDGYTIESQYNGMFLAKLNADNGNIDWVQNFGTGYANFNKISCDPTGNIITTGFYKSQLVLGNIELNTPYKSFFVAKFDPEGQVNWAKTAIVDNDGHTVAFSLALGLGGNIYIVGEYTGTIQIGSTTLMAPISNWNGFIAAYNLVRGNFVG